MTQHKRKDLATIRRRVEEDGDEEGGPDVSILDDDSFSEDSIQEDDLNDPEDNESQNSGFGSPVLSHVGLSLQKDVIEQQKASEPKTLRKQSITFPRAASNGTSDLDMMLNGLRLSEEVKAVDGVHFDELGKDDETLHLPVVGSVAHNGQLFETPNERRKREHEAYKKKCLEDPAFVPNRGAFFMHDHRHSGPAANGFRPYSRGRGRGRLGLGDSYPHNSTTHSHELSDAPWTHDMHDIISEPIRKDTNSGHLQNQSKINAKAISSPSKAVSPSRALSVSKSPSTVQIRVALPLMLNPVSLPGILLKQYTRLPDHRPPLRRDKPVRVSLPDHPTRYIYPEVDRSFVFIPRALRPNQQGFGSRGRGKSILGSGGGYSRRTSVFGGSIYGSGYSPSVVMSRRSSLAHDVNRETLSSPTGSAISRHQVGIVSSKPVVRLPPATQDIPQPADHTSPSTQDKSPPRKISGSLIRDPDLHHDKQTDHNGQINSTVTHNSENTSQSLQPNRPISDPVSSDDHSKADTIHQLKSHNSTSDVDVDSLSKPQYNPPQQLQQPFHNQVPAQVNGSNYSHEAMLHSRNTSYPIQTYTGTPLSQIPERAIHAQPFQPNPYQPHQQFYMQPYQVMPQPHNYYCPPSYNSTIPTPVTAPPFVQLPSQQPHHIPIPQTNQSETPQSGVQSLIAQEVNGMVYYYDAAQIPAVATFPAYQQHPSYPMQQVGSVGIGMMAPNPDGFYYTSTPQGIMYHPQ